MFKAQTTEAHLQFSDENNFVYVFVPPNLTNHFQLLDLNVNSHVKTFLKEKFQQWCAQQVQKELDSGKNIYQVDIKTRLSIMKAIHARWIISLYGKFRDSDEMVINAFQTASITEALTNENMEEDDPSSHL